MVWRAILCALVVVLLGTARAEATKNTTGPVRAAQGDEVVCAAANVSTGTSKNVLVAVTSLHADGSSLGDSTVECGTVAPGAACQFTAGPGSNTFSAFCTITFSGGKMRGTLCNVTKQLCADAR
jgi:hypothetical protein